VIETLTLGILTLDFYLIPVLKNNQTERRQKQMTNLGIEILFWTILISYLGLRFSQTWNGFKKQY